MGKLYFTFLPAHLGSPGQRADKRVCVCVRVQDTSVSANAVTEVKKDLTSIRQQLHQLFATEDQLLAELATLAVAHFPELVVQYPEFHLSSAIVRLLLTDVLTLHRKG